MKLLCSAMAAGFMVGLGCTSYLLVRNQVFGALLFSLGLFVICIFGMALFTGRVGYALEDKNPGLLATIWAGNLFGAILCAFVISVSIPEIAHLSDHTALLRLSQTTHKTAMLSMLCGILMYIAVETYKIHDKRGVFPCTGILLCVPSFILCGFEHSVADMFYFAAAGCLRQSFMHLLLVSFGNAVGAILTRQVLFRLR